MNRRAAVRATEKERSRIERHSSEEELARVRRAQRLEDETRTRAEEAYRRRLDGERRRRLQELELRTSRRQAEIEIRKSEVLARREGITESMRPIRDAARARAERIAELGELVHQARASVGALRVRIDAIEGDRRALWASTNAAIREVKARRDRLVFAYCSANVRARRGLQRGAPDRDVRCRWRQRALRPHARRSARDLRERVRGPHVARRAEREHRDPPSEEVQLLGILNGFPQTAVEGGVQVALGDAYGDERRRIVFELHIPELAALGVKKVADVVLRYVTVGAEVAHHEATIPLTVNLVSADEAAAAEADHEVTEEVVILKSALAQAEAGEHAECGEFDIARKLLTESADELRRLAPSSTQADELRRLAPSSTQADELLASAEMLGEHSLSMSPAAYSALVKKEMLYRSRTTSQRRKRER